MDSIRAARTVTAPNAFTTSQKLYSGNDANGKPVDVWVVPKAAPWVPATQSIAGLEDKGVTIQVWSIPANEGQVTTKITKLPTKGKLYDIGPYRTGTTANGVAGTGNDGGGKSP